MNSEPQKSLPSGKITAVVQDSTQQGTQKKSLKADLDSNYISENGDLFDEGQQLMKKAHALMDNHKTAQDPVAIIEQSIHLYQTALGHFEEGSKEFGLCQIGHAAALLDLAVFLPNQDSLYHETIDICIKAVACFPQDSNEMGVCILNQANANGQLAKLNFNQEIYLNNAIRCYESSIPILEEESLNFGIAHMNLANDFIMLSGLKTRRESLLFKAVHSCELAIPRLTEDSDAYCLCHLNLARSLIDLSRLTNDSRDLLDKATDACNIALSFTLKNTRYFVGSQINLGMAFLEIADITSNPVPMFQAAINYFDSGISSAHVASWELGGCHLNRANALLSLNSFNGDQMLLEEALRSYQIAVTCFEKGTEDLGNAHLGSATVLSKQAYYHSDPIDMYRKSFSEFELADQCISQIPNRLHLHADRAVAILEFCFYSRNSGYESLVKGWLERAWHDLHLASELLEQLVSDTMIEVGRRRLRMRYHYIYRNLAETCFNLADFEADPAQAEALRCEAWHAVGMSKGRSLREGLHRQSALEDHGVFDNDWDGVLDRFCRLERLGGGRVARATQPDASIDSTRSAVPPVIHGISGDEILRQWDQHSLALNVPYPEVPPMERWMEALATLNQDGKTLVAEFVGFGDGSCKVLLHDAGSNDPIGPPLILPNGIEDAQVLAIHLQAAVDWKSFEGAETGRVRRSPSSEPQTASHHVPHSGSEDVPLPDQVIDLASLISETRENGRWGELAFTLADWHGEPATRDSALECCRQLANILLTPQAIPNPELRCEKNWRDVAGILHVVTPEMGREAGLSIRQRQAFTDEASSIMNHVIDAMGELLEPLRKAIAVRPEWDQALLVLCPSGPFHLLPLAAARWSDQDRALIEDHPIIVLPTACYAEEVVQRRKQLDSSPRTVLRAFLAATDPFGKLTHIFDEVREAERRLKSVGIQVECVFDAEATAEIMREQEQTDIVHLAMHSGLDTHFELSGVEFHDRRLTILELLTRVRLHNARLAVVATCSSWQAHGYDFEADDPLALARAWILVGAGSALGALWPLHDAAARQFSDLFYHYLIEDRLYLAEAMRRAMIALKERYPGNPYAWAPYLLVGDPAMMLSENR